MIDKPMIDREKVRRMEDRHERVTTTADHVIRLLEPGEMISSPVRVGSQIIITILAHRRGAPYRDGRTRRLKSCSTVYSAAFESGAI